MKDAAALTLEDVQFRCHTCLCMLGGRGAAKRKPFSISTNSELQRLIVTNVEDVVSSTLKALPDYPQNVCRSCYRQLRNFVEFWRKARQTAQALRSVYDNSRQVVQQEDEAKVQGRGQSTAEHVDGADDALQESEYVPLLEPHVVVISSNENSQDPFSEAVAHTAPPELNNSDCVANKQLDVEQTKNQNEDCALETESDSDEQYIPPKTRTNQASATKKRQAKSSTNKVRHRGAAYRCEQCNRRFVRKYHYDAHLLEVHQGTPRPYGCDQCELNYKSHSALCYHKHVAHKLNGTNFPCETCGKSYKTETSLRYHRLVQHLGQKQRKLWICEHCGGTFAHSTSLVVHIKAKHAESYKCHICNKSFHSPYTLNYHNLREHVQDKPCVCKHCGLAFAKKFMLASHMRSHLSDADKLPCSHCSKRFINQKEVDKHVHMVHMKIKPYICTYCGESFGTPKTLRHHVYIHTGEKPYVCDVCGQAFRQPTAMKTHRNIHFKKQDVDANQ